MRYCSPCGPGRPGLQRQPATVILFTAYPARATSYSVELGYNYSRKTADWVAYRLTPAIHDDGNVDRQNDFRADTELPAIYQTTPADYVEPVFDQGHLANSESLDDTVLMNSETFLMSNMTPQLPGLNSAGWKGLENRERKWTDNRGELFIYAGPLFEGGLPSFIGNGVRRTVEGG